MLTFKRLGRVIKKHISVIIFSVVLMSIFSLAYFTHSNIYPKINNNINQHSSPISTATNSSSPDKLNEKDKRSKNLKSTTTKKSTTKRKTKSTTKRTSSSTTKRTSTTVELVIFPIDINRATLNELVQIENIGEITANKIITYRNSVGVIRSLDMLLNVDGIGDKTLNVLKEYLYVADDVYQENITSQVTTAPTTYSKKQTTSEIKNYKKVNINTASAKEISDSLLIEMTLARQIVQLRNQIQYFSSIDELFYIDDFPKEIYDTRKSYIVL